MKYWAYFSYGLGTNWISNNIMSINTKNAFRKKCQIIGEISLKAFLENVIY